MTQHAYQALPSLALFLAQRLAEVADHQQVMRHSSLAEGAAPQSPARFAGGEADIECPRRRAFETLRQAELFGAFSQQPLRVLSQQALSGAIDQPQIPGFVE